MGPGPWPRDAAANYSERYGLPALRSASLDQAYNLWLLDAGGERVGLLRPQDARPTWTRVDGLGQGAKGFPASVICGGAAERAYLGFLAPDLADPAHATAEQKAQGDADLLRARGDGAAEVEQHLTLVNSNDPAFDETRSILSCARVLQGEGKGDVYFGTNHAVTRVRGARFSDHRHAVFREPDTAQGSLRIGYNHAVSVTWDGELFLGNEWKIALLSPGPALEDFLDPARSPWRLDTFVEPLGPQAEADAWRATAQTVGGRYFAGAKEKGLWEVILSPRRYAKVAGLPTERITALAAARGGALFVGTADAGLFRWEPNGRVEPVAQVRGRAVRELFYDRTLEPGLLLALTDEGLFVLRGE